MNVQLHLGDCLEVMRSMPDKSVDAVITDPPYGIGFGYRSGREETDSPDDYWNLLSPIYNEIERILRPGGFLAIWQANKYFSYFWKWFGNDIRIYAGCKNFVQLRKTPINYGFDPIVVKYKSGVPLRPEKPRRNLDYFVANTAKWVTQTDSLARQHPCPRPIDQVQELVENFVLEDGTVLDCFAGSGTTGVACVQTGRNFIGIEIDPTYFAIAERRIQEAQLQTRLPLEAAQQ